jgi:CBS domain-containing membrane protein
MANHHMTASAVADRMSHPVLTVRPGERLDIARTLMLSTRRRHLCVVEGGRLTGVLSLGDVLASAPLIEWPDARARAVALRDIPVEKCMRSPVVTIASTASLHDAAALLERRRVGCLPVVEGERLVGILTRTDVLAEAIAAIEQESPPATVARLMTPWPLLMVSPDDPLDLAHALMKGERVRHLPVVEGERLVGMLSQHDVLAAVGEAATAGEKRAVTVGEVMSAPAVHIAPERRASEAIELLYRRRLGALPVVRGGRLVGIVSTADCFYYLASSTPTSADRAAR